MARRLPSFTDAFFKYTEGRGSPDLFRKWAGLFTVAAALERKVWIKTSKGVLYPNLYVITVGPPGAGKTLSTALAHDLIQTLNTGDERGHHIAPSSVTKASLIDAMEAAKRKVIRLQDKEQMVEFNSLTVTADELGVFLPAYENDFMNTMTNIYDCRIYSETRRSSKINIKMDAPQLNFMAATTPSYLNNFLPEGAWDQGFLSRTMLVYSGADGPSDLFRINGHDENLYRDMKADLKEIGELYGKMEWTAEASEAINAWHMAGGPPEPDHPKLLHYNTRRTAHLLKLCTVVSAAQSNDLLITLEHYAEALDLLIEAETRMADIFKSMTTGGSARAIEECWHFCYTIWMKDKKPILEHRLVAFLSERVPIHEVDKILAVMERAQIIVKKMSERGGNAYEPRPPKQR